MAPERKPREQRTESLPKFPKPSCDRSDADCPHGALLEKMAEDFEEFKEYLMGTDEKIGLIQKVRNLEFLAKVLLSGIGVGLTTAITLLVTQLMSK